MRLGDVVHEWGWPMGFLASVCSASIWLGCHSLFNGAEISEDDNSKSHAQIVVCIDGMEVVTVLSDVSHTHDGKSVCVGKIKDQGQEWSLAWDFVLDLDARDDGHIRGKTIWFTTHLPWG